MLTLQNDSSSRCGKHSVVVVVEGNVQLPILRLRNEENGRRQWWWRCTTPSPIEAGLAWLDLEHLKAVEGAGPEPQVVLGGGRR